jgi:hypothetical protein
MNTVTLCCSVCKTSFKRGKSEAERNEKLKRPIYCSRSCAGKGNIRNIPLDAVWTKPPKPRSIDELSPFRICHRSARTRARLMNKECDIRLEDLKELWERQGGICPYTGWELQLPLSCRDYSIIAKVRNPKRASLDRIDSSKGYIRGNVQFVCHMANIAKCDYTHEQMLEFCRAITAQFAPDDSP